MSRSESIFSDSLIGDLGLPEWLVENCAAMGITKATNIQKKAIPSILKGRDVIGRAKTGSGKTAAFALPILHRLSDDPYGIFALILTPTRELAMQIGDQMNAFSANTGFRSAIIYGGSGFITNTGQIEDRPHIVIATPGRLADLINGGTEFGVEELKYLVIDEADQLLCNKNFIPSLKTIFGTLPPASQRQTLLFSATLDSSMKRLYKILQLNSGDDDNQTGPEFIEASQFKLDTTSNISQTYAFIPEMSKESYLIAMLTSDKFKKKSMIIFISSREYCQIMAGLLRKFKLQVSELHGNIKQKNRLHQLMKFRAGKTRILVATDVASRGLDIPQVEYVINFDIPRTPLEYVHRIGRCGRVDRHGTAVTFVSQFDVALLKEIEKHTHNRLKSFNITQFEEQAVSIIEQVLIKRAQIVNRMETRYLTDAEELKKHPSLRWKGYFTDPRLSGKSRSNNRSNKSGIDRSTLKEDLDYLAQMTKDDSSDNNNSDDGDDAVNDKTVALDTNKDGNQNKSALSKEDLLSMSTDQTEENSIASIVDKFKSGRYKYEKKYSQKKAEPKFKSESKPMSQRRRVNTDNDDDDNDSDYNMALMDEEVRLMNANQSQHSQNGNSDGLNHTIENSEMDSEGNTKLLKRDLKAMHGWTSFRYGKHKYQWTKLRRTARANESVLKRQRLERIQKFKGAQTRAKIISEIRKSVSDIETIPTKANNNPNHYTNSNTNTNTNTKSEFETKNGKRRGNRGRRAGLRKMKKEGKWAARSHGSELKNGKPKKMVLRLSSSLKKKMTDDEQKRFLDRKQDWFGNENKGFKWS